MTHFHIHRSLAREPRLLRFANPEAMADPELPAGAKPILQDIDALAAKLKDKKFEDVADDVAAIQAALKVLIGAADKNEQPKIIDAFKDACKAKGLLLTVAADKQRGGFIVLLTPLAPAKPAVPPKEAMKKIDPAEPINKFEKDTLLPLLDGVDRGVLAQFMVKFRTYQTAERADLVKLLETMAKSSGEKKTDFLTGYMPLAAENRQLVRLLLQMTPEGWTDDDRIDLTKYYVLHAKLSQTARNLFYSDPHFFLEDPTLKKAPNVAGKEEVKKFVAKLQEDKLMRVAFQLAIRSEFLVMRNQFVNNPNVAGMQALIQRQRLGMAFNPRALAFDPVTQGAYQQLTQNIDADMAKALQDANDGLLKEINARHAKRKAANPDYPAYSVAIPKGRALPELVAK